MRRSAIRYAVLAVFAGAGIAHGDILYSISGPSVVTPGETDGAFDVLITNTTGSASVDIAAFTFQATVSDTDISLNSADTSPTADPYIFAGDSFDDINGFTLDVPNANIPPQTLTGIDLTNDDANIVLTGGETLSLGEVLFSVAPGAAPGPFTVSFSCLVYYDPASSAPPNGLIAQPAADCNNLSDGSGNPVNVDGMNEAESAVEPAAAPEASTFLLAGAGLLALAGAKRVGRGTGGKRRVRGGDAVAQV